MLRNVQVVQIDKVYVGLVLKLENAISNVYLFLVK